MVPFYNRANTENIQRVGTPRRGLQEGTATSLGNTYSSGGLRLSGDNRQDLGRSLVGTL